MTQAARIPTVTTGRSAVRPRHATPAIGECCMPISVPSHDQTGCRSFAGAVQPGAPGFAGAMQPGGPGFVGTMQRRTTLLIGAIIVAGLVFVLGLWTEVFVLVGSEQSAAIAHARTDASNLSAAFQEEVSRGLDSVTAAMPLIAARMRADPGTFDIYEWSGRIQLMAATTIQAAVIGPDGRLRSTTLDPHAKPTDLSDREHFRVHLDGAYHGLFIGKPVLGRVSGRTSIPVSLRVDAADGRFLGVIVFQLSPGRLTTLHQAIDFGPRGMIALFGTDNILRARFGADSPDGTTGIGGGIRTLPERSGADGTRDVVHIAESPVDHVVRVYSDRRLAGYPLFVAVGLDLDDVLAATGAQATQIEATATGGSLL